MNDDDFMRLALQIAQKGEGFVEPNPMVGCVLVQNGQIIGQGYHTQFGNPHAEVEAVRSAPYGDINGATCYVTLEPCSHYGKTPPCVNIILQAGIRRVVIAQRDPNPLVNGRGIQILRNAGIAVTENVLEAEARRLNAPYLTLIEKQRPWIHTKWAMTLDGRLASKTFDSKWISGEESRKTVHQLRSRMDAVIIGVGTAEHDNPLLTVRINNAERRGNKIPYRVILDSAGTLSPESRIVQTAEKMPVLIVTETQNSILMQRWKQSGCEVLHLPRSNDFLTELLKNFAQRNWTNILVEGGRKVFGMFFDSQCIDEVHAFIAPKLIGGDSALPIFGGIGLDTMQQAAELESPEIKQSGEDVYVHGRIKYRNNGARNKS